MAASKRKIQELLDKLEGEIAAAFSRAVEQIRSQARINELIAAIEIGDLEAVMVAAGIRPGAWNELTEQIRSAYIEAGAFMIAADVPRRFGMVFDYRNPRAEAWLAEHSSTLIVQINDGQRAAIRAILEAGVAAGRNPRSIGLDIVGRISPQTGRRAGGIIGLWGPEPGRAPGSTPVEWVEKCRAELEDLDEAYFNRERRDRRFDKKIQKAIDAGTPLSAADIDRIVGRYEDRLLELRGSTIGRTEALQSLNNAGHESLRQVVDQGLAQGEAVTRIWRSAGRDGRTRETHLELDGTEVVGLEALFESPSGALMLHPGDFSNGAPASEIINCRCIVEHKVDFIAIERAR